MLVSDNTDKWDTRYCLVCQTKYKHKKSKERKFEERQVELF